MTKAWISWFAAAAAVSGAVATGCAGGGSGGSGSASQTATSSGDGFTSNGTSSSGGSTSGASKGQGTGTGTGTGSGTGGATGTGTSGTGTTGCVDGAEGCPCLDTDPQCNDGLVCIAQQCAQPLCPDDMDEPNDDHTQAVHLPDKQDSDGTSMMSSQLAGTADVDWWVWSCTDTTAGELIPTVMIDQSNPMRFCMFLDCVVGGNPSLDCTNNTTPAMAPFGYLPGCCTTNGDSFDFSTYNCPNSSDDSVIVYFLADMGTEEVCIDYSVTYGC